MSIKFGIVFKIFTPNHLCDCRNDAETRKKEDIFIVSFYKDIRRWKENDPLTAFNPTKTGPFVLYTAGGPLGPPFIKSLSMLKWLDTWQDFT